MKPTGSRALLNVGLLVLVVALALIAVYLPGLKKPAPPSTLTRLHSNQITRIHIERGGKQPVTFVKNKQGWDMTAPFHLPVNPFRIESIVRLAETQSSAAYPAQNVDLTKLKLAEPQVRLRLNDVELVFGDTEALQGRRYVLVGQTVYLVPDNDFFYLQSDAVEFLDLALLPSNSQLVELGLPNLQLTRQKDGHWSLNPPKPGTSMDDINALLDQWRNAQASYIKPYEKKEPQGTVTLRSQGAQDPIRFEITQRTPELVLASPERGVQYHLLEELADRLLELPEQSPPNKEQADTGEKPEEHQHNPEDHQH